MKIKIQSLHLTLKPDLANFITEHLAKLSLINDRILAGEVCLKIDKSNILRNKVCEIRLLVPGNDLFAKRNSKTFQEATTEVIAALHSQLLKQKTKFEARKIAEPNDALVEELMENYY